MSAPIETTDRRASLDVTLPPMKTFPARRAAAPLRSNEEIARDFLDLAFSLESGRELPRLTRFEQPVSLRVTGMPGGTLDQDLAALLGRLKREAGIDIRRVPANTDANITIEIISREQLRRAVPQAACFVVPRISSWREFRRERRSDRLDWSSLTIRERVAIFIPAEVSPQETRDCLHEELAQALGPLNDLYRLPDSVFNDDNFHNVLTGFDMVILRAFYDSALVTGMTRDEVAARLPAILNRINPEGRRPARNFATPTPRSWISAIETSLGPGVSSSRRKSSVSRAIQIAESQRWRDSRLGFALFAQGRLLLSSDSEAALAAFLQANAVYGAQPGTELQQAHVGMQIAAFALSSGQSDVALTIINQNIPIVLRAENAALLSTMLMIKAEALTLEGRMSEARTVRLDSLGWARYGFGSDSVVRQRLGDIALLSPRLRQRG